MDKIIKLMIVFWLTMLVSGCNSTQKQDLPSEITMTKAQLLDKIKGGWAGQAIGCTYGGPTEFKYQGTMINDKINIRWPDGYLKSYFDKTPGLYDDIYMDLTFVDVFEKKGLDVPVEEFAKAFSTAEYQLWHANQAARYNIRHGLMPPSSGYWENNPHADDIDFQIEADYAGLMSPGMVNAASFYCDDIGHMMNYGDGWYGGVFVAAMYSIAFISNDINFIVDEALKTIPSQSKYHKCMSDIIRWHKQYPNDWEITWALCQKNWSFDIGCPEGVYYAFNIDAVINSAYILIGLLYGQGDFYKTIDIATRCGQDSDCNPASAAGILGTMIGYSKIPEYWMTNLREVEDLDFAYTDISLNKAYQMSFNQAIQVIEKNGGQVNGDNVTIVCQVPEMVRFEESFAGHWPVSLDNINKPIMDVEELSFNGNGVVVCYSFGKDKKDYEYIDNSGYIAVVDVFLDGKIAETVNLPVNNNNRKLELFFKYNLPLQNHILTFDWKNPENNRTLNISSMLVYSNKPEVVIHK